MSVGFNRSVGRFADIACLVLTASAALLFSSASSAQTTTAAMGTVVLDCAWTATQGVNDCKLVQEAPVGLGLGVQALSAAQGFNMVSGYQPPLQNGRFQLRIGVRLPQPATASSQAPSS